MSQAFRVIGGQPRHNFPNGTIVFNIGGSAYSTDPDRSVTEEWWMDTDTVHPTCVTQSLEEFMLEPLFTPETFAQSAVDLAPELEKAIGFTATLVGEGRPIGPYVAMLAGLRGELNRLFETLPDDLDPSLTQPAPKEGPSS